MQNSLLIEAEERASNLQQRKAAAAENKEKEGDGRAQ
jgi:hypothetical protein